MESTCCDALSQSAGSSNWKKLHPVPRHTLLLLAKKNAREDTFLLLA
jgi:hypothetical protein